MATTRNQKNLIYCGKRMFLPSKSKRRKRACACRMETLRGVNLNLFEAGVGACQADSSLTAEEFLCKNNDPAYLFSHYGIIDCGYDPNTSIEAQIYEDKQNQSGVSADQQRNILIGSAILLVGLLLYFILK